MTGPRITGFCNGSNPPDSHARCSGEFRRGPGFDAATCECSCHQPTETAEDRVGGPGPRLGVYDALDEAEYHQDPTSVSASGMKSLLRSPAHFLHERTHPKTSTAMDLGSVAHSMVLGTGCEYVAIEGNRNRNDVKAAIAEAEAEGKVVLKPEQLSAAERMADAVLTHRHAARLLASPGRSEVSMFWQDPVHDVIRRCRWDRLTDAAIGVDLKTAASADPATLPKRIVEYGYDLSAAWYLEVAAGLDIELAAYALVFVEATEPHPVVVAELSGPFLDRGAALARKALTAYRRCLDTGQWPAYADHDFLTLHPPAWVPDANQIQDQIAIEAEGTAA